MSFFTLIYLLGLLVWCLAQLLNSNRHDLELQTDYPRVYLGGHYR
jgi:hypothetical protein